jgi:hypothetical protein
MRTLSCLVLSAGLLSGSGCIEGPEREGRGTYDTVTCPAPAPGDPSTFSVTLSHSAVEVLQARDLPTTVTFTADVWAASDLCGGPQPPAGSEFRIAVTSEDTSASAERTWRTGSEDAVFARVNLPILTSCAADRECTERVTVAALAVDEELEPGAVGWQVRASTEAVLFDHEWGDASVALAPVD